MLYIIGVLQLKRTVLYFNELISSCCMRNKFLIQRRKVGFLLNISLFYPDIL